MAYRFLLEVPESLAEAASIAVEAPATHRCCSFAPRTAWVSTIPTST